MRTYIFTTLQMTKLLVRRYFRNRTAIFFSVVFPLLLLFVFGAISGNSNGASFKVAVFNESQTPFSAQFTDSLDTVKALKVQKNIKSFADAKEQMNRSAVDAIIVLPPDFGTPNRQSFPSGQAEVYYSQNNVSAGQTVSALMQSVLGGVNAKLTNIQPPLTVAAKSTAAKNLSAFDYTFSGLLGFSLLGLGIFGPINILPAEKKTGALTRLRVTPLRPAQFIVGYMLSSLATGVISITAMFVVAIVFFHFHMTGSYLAFIPFAALGAIMIFGIGVGVGGWAKDEKQSAPLGNLVAFPMMFLSGIFFPRFLMPEWLQHFTAFIPLTPVIDGMRAILTEGKGLLELGPQLGIMAVWLVLIYAVSFRVFRWE